MAFGNRRGQREEFESPSMVDEPRGKIQKTGFKQGIVIGAVVVVLLGILLRGALAENRHQPVSSSQPAQSQTVAPPAGNAQIPGRSNGSQGYSYQTPPQQGLTQVYGYMSQIGGLIGRMMGGLGGLMGGGGFGGGMM